MFLKRRKSRQNHDSKASRKMKEVNSNWFPMTTRCEDNLFKSYSLDFSNTNAVGEKIYTMNVSYILEEQYLLTVQRTTRDFGSSTFQVVLWDSKEIKDAIENRRNLRQQLIVPLNDDEAWTNHCFDLHFSEIYQVNVMEGDKLIIVGRTKNNNDVIEQFNFSVKGDSKKIRMKNDFALSFTSRRLVVKRKNVIPILQGVDIPASSHVTVVALRSEGLMTSFVYQISSFGSDNRWVVCLYNGQAKRANQQFQFIELTSHIVQGSISSACFLKNEMKLVLVTTAFQLLIFDIQKTGLSLKNIRLLCNEYLLFDAEHENIYLQKIKYACFDTDKEKELMIACSTSGRLFFIPETLNSFNTEIHSLDFSTSIIDEDGEKLYVEQFTSCDFTKQCVITCRSGRVYTFDIFNKMVVHKTNINTETNANYSFEIGTDFSYQFIDLNQFGDELHHLQDNKFNVHFLKPSFQNSLQELCRVKILDNLPVEDIMRSNISNYVKRIIS